MNIVYKKPSEIQPYKNNPRKNDKAIGKVVKSIQEYGFKQPVVVDSNGIIIVGHTRWKSALKLGLKEIPVLIADDLDEKKAKAYRIADNKTNEFAEWDFELLDLELLDLDLDWLGFESIGDEGYGEDFTLPDRDKEPFQQITFTLADAQAEEIKSMLVIAKKDNMIETFGNENSNGNGLYRIVREWAEQRI